MTAEDAIRKQEKAAIAYAVARETHNPRRPEVTTWWQILAAHQALMARRAMGLHLDEGQP